MFFLGAQRVRVIVHSEEVSPRRNPASPDSPDYRQKNNCDKENSPKTAQDNSLSRSTVTRRLKYGLLLSNTLWQQNALFYFV